MKPRFGPLSHQEAELVVLDGRRVYAALSAGAVEVIGRQDHLNRINVFPVPDGDTGTNLAATLYSMTQAEPVPHDAGSTVSAMAEAALLGARGNSGIIFAQFLDGFRERVSGLKAIDIDGFVHAMQHAAGAAAAAMADPRDGTIISVIRDWTEALRDEAPASFNFLDLFHRSIPAAEESLRRTPSQLEELRAAGVVDAGAQGFVDFLHGAGKYIATGKETAPERLVLPRFSPEHAALDFGLPPSQRYCTECVLRGAGLDPSAVRSRLSGLGGSLIVAGGGSILRVHIHADDPAAVFARLRGLGNPSDLKVDDMKAQMEDLHGGGGIALVTDSTCDLPAELLDRYRIHVVPVVVRFGEAEYLDRVTLTSGGFFELAKASKVFPTTSQPPGEAFRRLYSFLASYYGSIIAIHLSSKLSGTCGGSAREAAAMGGARISVIDSRQVSGSLGLLVLRAARAIERGLSHDEVVAEIEAAREKTRIFVSVRSLDYMVRGGRVSPLRGIAAKLLNIRPIVSLDAEGRSTLIGKALSMAANERKIARMARELAAGGKLLEYALVHGSAPEAAARFARRLERRLGMPPSFIAPISPVIGLNAGPGSVALVATRD
jgi:DegV family protein with EDD domain